MEPRILLVYPSGIVGRGNMPVNIPILQSVLKQKGYEVRLFDNTKYQRPDYNILLTNTGVFKKTDEENYNSMVSQNNPFEDFEELCKKFDPNIIGISCLTADFRLSLRFVQIAKKINPEVITIYGGIHPTIVPEQVLNHSEVDFVCVGEGEEAILEFANQVASRGNLFSVRNIWSKKSEIVKTTLRPFINLDKIPFQDLSGFEEFHFYRPFDGKLYRMASVETSRGCPFQCTYCVNATLRQIYKGLGDYYRTKSVGRVIEELVYLKNRYNFNFFLFIDDDFTSHGIEYLKELCEEYKQKVNLPFLIYARCETITDEKLKILKDMGCKTLAVGIESGNEYIRKHVMNRIMSNDSIIEKFNLVHKYKIRVSAYNIIGSPYETRESIFETIELNRKCKSVTSTVAFLSPYPKTKIREILIKEKMISSNYIPESNFSEPQFELPSLTKKELKGLYKTFNLYRKLPKLLYPLIAFCEKERLLSNIIYKFLVNKFLN